jgi:hypothetical protein
MLTKARQLLCIWSWRFFYVQGEARRLETALLAIGAALLGVAVVSLAWMWATQQRDQQRDIVDALRQLLADCETRRESDMEGIRRTDARVIRAQHELENLYSANKILVDKTNAQDAVIRNLERELAATKAAQAGRQLTRREDDER